MVWEQNTPCVVMLTQFEEVLTNASGKTYVKEKSFRYLPQDPSDAPHAYGEFVVECLDRVALAPGLARRRLAVKRASAVALPDGEERASLAAAAATAAAETRFVEHIHFTAWPDFGCVSADDMKTLFLALDAMRTAAVDAKRGAPPLAALDGPPVLHCSAGIGRSGAFAAVALVQMQVEADRARDIDVLDIVTRLRNERPGMVQSVSQYEMIYDALAYTLGLER